MIVDDQKFIRQMIGKSLLGMGGYQVIESEDGMAAIKVMRDMATKMGGVVAGADLMEQKPTDGVRIGCIVSDINMLPMNGLEFVKAIRCGLTPVARGTPVIMLTGHAEKQFLATAIALDVSGFLVKPVSATVLRERIERAAASPVALKTPSEYATLIVPDIESKELWSSSAALENPTAPVRAGDLLNTEIRSRPVDLADLKVGDRLAEDLLTVEKVLVVPSGSKVAPALIAAIKDLSEIVKLQPRVAVFRD